MQEPENIEEPQNDAPSGEPIKTVPNPPAGTPVNVPAPVAASAPEQKISKPKGFAITSMVCGIAALAGFWVPFVNILNILLAIVALTFGIIALVKVSRGEWSGKGFGIAGIVTSGVAILLSLIVSVFCTCVVAGAFIETVTEGLDERTVIGDVIEEEECPWYLDCDDCQGYSNPYHSKHMYRVS